MQLGDPWDIEISDIFPAPRKPSELVRIDFVSQYCWFCCRKTQFIFARYEEGNVKRHNKTI